MKHLFLLLWLIFPVILSGTPNIIVITLDTTRADRLGSYGYTEPTSPYMDSLAKKGILFKNAICTVPTTLPSHTSIFSGLYPFNTQVRHNLRNVVPGEIPLLAEELKRAGYATAAVISSHILHKRFGLSRGFDIYEQTMKEGENQRSGDLVTDAAVKILSKSRKPFFLWAHYYDPHHPYTPPEPFDGRFSSPYDGEIAFMDQQIRRLLNSIPEKTFENTIVFIAGDHGEGLGDHGEEEHGILLYKPTMQVPFIVYGKNVPAAIIDTTVSVASIAPTVLEAAGRPIPESMSDLPSLWKGIQGERVKQEWYYMETYLPYFSFNWAPMRSITNGRWKYIQSPDEELFDLANDPGEKNNLSERKRDILDRLIKRLDKLSPEKYGELVEAEPVKMTPEELKNLQSLGYLQGGSRPSKATGDLPDPKTLVDISDEILIKAPDLLETRGYEELETMMMEVIRRDRQNLPAMKYLATAYIGLNKLDEAKKVLLRANKISPNTYYILTKLGIVYYKQGDIKKGISSMERSFDINPYNVEVIGYYAQALIMDKQTPEALKVLAFAKKNNLVDGNTMVAWGIVHMQNKSMKQALASFEKAIQLNPDTTIAYANMGYLYHLTGKPEKSFEMMNLAYKLEPDNSKTLKALIGILLQLKRYPEAKVRMQEYISKFPNAPDNRFVKEQLQQLSRY